MLTLSPNQSKALDELRPIAEIALSNQFKNLPIHPRTNSLICAPSGTGKSHLMNQLGDELGVSVLRLNVSTWQPVGSRGDNYTWDKIVAFLKQHPRGIIVLDEIDKIDSNSDWAGHIRLEIHDLLDGVIPQSVSTGYSPIKDDESDNDIW